MNSIYTSQPAPTNPKGKTVVDFNIRTVNLAALNSLTKYPSIPTYHELDPKNGGLLDNVVKFPDAVIGTEKVDGTNARIIMVPGGAYLLGSWEELLYAEGDLIGNPSQGIVAALQPVAGSLWRKLTLGRPDAIRVLYVELFGGKVGANAKQYTRHQDVVGWRLFDVATISRADWQELLPQPERVALWREHGGQNFATEEQLLGVELGTGIKLTPRLFTVDGSDLPTGIEDTRDFLAGHLPQTQVKLDESGLGTPEGIVFRSPDRLVIAKARFQDYERTLKRRSKK